MTKHLGAKHLNEIQRFLKTKQIKDKFQWFQNKGELGYEKWLQHELAYWMESNGHDAVIEETGIPPNQ